MMMDTITEDFRRKVSEQVRIEGEGVGRFRVFTPFMFEDGDHLSIVLKKLENQWVLSDEGHTFMHLTYDLDERDLRKGTREKVITNALTAFSVKDANGVLLLWVEDGQFGDALYTFVQALMRIADVTYLSRERVKSAFFEDFRTFMSAAVPEERREFDWHSAQYDTEKMYPADCYVNRIARPLAIFALGNDEKVRDATITLHQYERWGLNVRGVGIFQDQEEINRRVLARFTDVCDRQFSSLSANKDRIVKFIEEAIG
ncbi:DUF1828 domain-containing protein [Fimbriimonadia bacterium ATM]|nr:MAG: DUF1828 domain-containing protein [Armatimonadota bacterium]MBC6970427.1 DUF1828 domain-containing protein [Armatimonadota bacterium]MCE7899832.1 DUF1828 domain-containing protein [Armatimonadetes bacterium ATM1]MDL1928714.1 DUF1828 domain-containing protein [Fimbriimonadia bacterium ATM]RIJ94056.1 MAG: hypothetical protein DCC45_13110 [Armatimonadota bacterium]